MSLTWRRSRITGAGLVAAQYDLTLERQTIMDNILFIPGLANPVSEINQLLFGQGQQGTFIAPSLTASLISGSTFGTGVETLPDLSPRNNPFSQANSGNRAAWFREPKTGRRNLFEQTESLIASSGWSVPGTPTVKDYSGEGIGAEFTTVATGGADQVGPRRTITLSGATAGRVYTYQIRIRSISGTNTITVRSVESGGASAQSGVTSDSIQLTSQFQTIQVQRTISANDRTTLDVFVRSTEAGTYVLDILHPQLELGSTATNYQRVTTAFDVTESGQRDCFGVRADGIDDFYTTASTDFTGTDKVTVFAAVRKLSDAVRAAIIDLSADPQATDGTFQVEGPGGTLTDTYRFGSRGTAFISSAPVGFAAPITSILTQQSDISAPRIIGRVNGVEVANNVSSQGTGNYRNDVLYLFRRGGTTLPFNGNLYALIVAGGSYPLSTIERVERILSRITPTVNL
jgi:hypothetical protein